MRVCPECGAIYLASVVGLECRACSARGDNGDIDYLGVWLRDLTNEERIDVYHWLLAYPPRTTDDHG